VPTTEGSGWGSGPPEKYALQCEDEHCLCGCVTDIVRDVMAYWTGTNCTWVDDDVKALGILAGMAIEAGLYKKAAIPKTMIDAIEAKVATMSAELSNDDL
jgi:hypothetical protein